MYQDMVRCFKIYKEMEWSKRTHFRHFEIFSENLVFEFLAAHPEKSLLQRLNITRPELLFTPMDWNLHLQFNITPADTVVA